MLPRPSGSYSGAASLPLPLRLLQPLSHLLVIRGVQCPPLCRAVPAVVPDLHVDAAVDEELHGRVVRVKDELVQDARRLMGAPGGVDVCAVVEQEVSHVEVVVDDGPCERHVEHVLLLRCCVPLARIFLDSILWPVWTVGVV